MGMERGSIGERIAFHRKRAVIASRRGDGATAWLAIAEAERAAGLLHGEGGDDFDTEFGPANVALHAVSVAVELGRRPGRCAGRPR